jgi:ubiquinone/menaquinone biosynthesis C-methylase UbiE
MIKDFQASSAGRRRSSRVECALAVSGAEVLLGEARNISLDGLFLATDRPPPGGSVVPVRLSMGRSAFRAEAQVQHVGPEGAGLRFVHVSDEDQRVLRRFVNDLVSLNATRRTIQATLDGPRAPVRDPEAIAAIVATFVGAEAEVLAAVASVRVVERVVRASGDGIELARTGPLEPGAAAFAAVTVDFTCWSFTTTVLGTRGRLRLALPERLISNERRANPRTPPPAGTRLQTDSGSWPVVETTAQGLSVSDGAGLKPGDRMTGLLVAPGREPEEIGELEVRHVRPGPDGTPYVGLQRVRYTRTPVPVMASVRVAPTWWQTGVAVVRTVAGTAMSKLLGRKDEVPAAEQVRFPRSDGLEVVGLLDRTWTDAERRRAPLIVVVPAFAGRKEQCSALGRLAVACFAGNDAPVAVLRIDGTNNLGASGKQPGFEAPGLHTLRYTASGVMGDVQAALDWAHHNPYVDVDGVLIVSLSFASVPVRGMLRGGGLPEVKGWIAHMGAADAQDSILHVSGHIDAIAIWRAHGRVGEVTLVGCPVDGDRFCPDLEVHGLSTLDDALADLSTVRVPVTWVVGTHDRWVDRRRVTKALEVMPADVPHGIVEFDSGHLPTSGVEAFAQFAEIARIAFRMLHGRAPAEWPDVPPAVIKLRSDEEWSRVRSATLPDRAAFWKLYMVGDGGGVGFDVMALSGGYVGFAALEADLVEPDGRRLLDLGAGTGLVALELARRGAASLALVDLIDEAVQRAAERVRPLAQVEAIAMDLDHAPLPFADGEFDGAIASLLLSYLADPIAVLHELRRVLRPGSRLVVSSMRPGADTAAEFLDVVTRLQRGEVDVGSRQTTAAELVAEARRFHGLASGAFRLEEEGHFHFFTDAELIELVETVGFRDAVAQPAFGSPPAAWIVTCTR